MNDGSDEARRRDGYLSAIRGHLDSILNLAEHFDSLGDKAQSLDSRIKTNNRANLDIEQLYQKLSSQMSSQAFKEQGHNVTNELEALARDTILGDEREYHADRLFGQIRFWRSALMWIQKDVESYKRHGCDVNAIQVLSPGGLERALQKNPKNLLIFSYLLSLHDAYVAKYIDTFEALGRVGRGECTKEESDALLAAVFEWSDDDSLEKWRKNRNVAILAALSDVDPKNVKVPTKLSIPGQITIKRLLEAVPDYRSKLGLSGCADHQDYSIDVFKLFKKLGVEFDASMDDSSQVKLGAR